MEIMDLLASDEQRIRQTAAILMAGFDGHPAAWPHQEAALQEVENSLSPEQISRVALSECGNVLGWIAGQSSYGGNVWELHPLVVSVKHQGQGIGRALVHDFEIQVRERGGLTIILGTDDEDDSTTLSGANLFNNLAEQIAQIRPLKRHPYLFYQKLGYSIVGVVPDANGLGKPDILMAKSVLQQRGPA